MDIESAPLEPVLRELREGAATGAWIKCVFSHPVGVPGMERWDRLTAEPVRVSRGPAVKLVRHDGDHESTATVAAAAWDGELDRLMSAGPKHINLLGRDHDYHARLAKSGRWLVSRGKPSLVNRSATAELPKHDREPIRALPPGEPDVLALLVETGLYGLNGKLRGEAAQKYRQVQHYLELLRPLEVMAPSADGAPLRIVDAGCGRAYLSLALYLFAQRQGRTPGLVGVDRNADLLATVEDSAASLGYTNTIFRAEDIAAYAASTPAETDILVSLHACDTATDEALAAGVRLDARAIVLVPCCHHELVAQIDERLKAEPPPPAAAAWAAMTGSGLLRQRLADLITDALRVVALEASGYRVDVVEFVSPDITARNVMLRAEQRPPGAARDAAAVRGAVEFRALADAWGVAPAVESLLAGVTALR
jgi:hypothetical protein